MIFLSAFLLSIVLNLETLRISLSYGIKKKFFTKTSTILLALITSFGTFISMYVCQLILHIFNPTLGNLFGATLLSFTGVYFIVEYIRLERKHAGLNTSYFFERSLKYDEIIKNPDILDSNKLTYIDFKECLVLSQALVLYNLWTYFAAGITSINISLSVFFNFIIIIFIIYFLNFNSNIYISKWFSKYSNLISGVILITLGVFETFM